MVCLRQSCSYSAHWPVAGSKRPSFFEPACATQIEPSGAGTAEWISAGPGFGTRYSFISPVAGLKCAIRFDEPYCGIQNVPSLAGCAVQGKRSGPGHLVVHIDDAKRLVGDRRQRVLVARHLGRRPRQRRVLAEHLVHVERDVFRLLVAEAAPVGERGAHRLAHVFDAAAPAVVVAHGRRHLALEAVAAHAVVDQHVLAARIRQKLDALQDRNLGPAHHALLQREVVRDVLLGGELDAALGLGAEARPPGSTGDSRPRAGSRRRICPGYRSAR